MGYNDKPLTQSRETVLFCPSVFMPSVKAENNLKFMVLVPILTQCTLQWETGILLWLSNNSCPHKCLFLKPPIHAAGPHPKSIFGRHPYTLWRPHQAHRPVFFRRTGIPEPFRGSYSKGHRITLKGRWLKKGQGRNAHITAPQVKRWRASTLSEKHSQNSGQSFHPTCEEGPMSYLLKLPTPKCRINSIWYPLKVEHGTLKDTANTLRVWWLMNSETLIVDISGTFFGNLDV